MNIRRFFGRKWEEFDYWLTLKISTGWFILGAGLVSTVGAFLIFWLASVRWHTDDRLVLCITYAVAVGIIGAGSVWGDSRR